MKPISEMRHPASSRGQTPTTCHACRSSHPGLAWCDDHGEPHPIDRFPETNRPIGVLNICDDAVAFRAAAKRTTPDRECPSCRQMLASWYFRGGRNKMSTCRSCTDAHPDDRWCAGCEGWLPRRRFFVTGTRRTSFERRCKACRVAHSHGVTVAHLQELTGSTEPRCGACGATDWLKIDHDHNHCAAQRGCAECVRGYLCHACNTAEGLLRTPGRARMLAEYMEKHSIHLL